MIKLFMVGLFCIAATRPSGIITVHVEEGAVSAQLKEGYHFNLKAPNGVAIEGQFLKPTAFEARRIEIKNLPSHFTEGRATFYYCDDATTFCEAHEVRLKGGKKMAALSVKTAAKASAYRGGRTNKHGFIEDDFEQALAMAKKKDRLVLIDFSARWCPSCVRLETEMFDTAEFRKLTQDYVKLKIDVDRFTNGIVSEKFKIRGIPTLLVMNSRQEEIDRLLDYQPIDVMKNFFNAIEQDSTSLNKLVTAATDDQGRYRLAKRLLSAERAREALVYFSKMNPRPSEYWDAFVAAAEADASEEPKKKSAFIKALREAIQNEPQSVRSLGWRSLLVEQLDEVKQKLKVRDEGVRLADGLLADSDKFKEALKTTVVGEYTGYEPMLVHMLRGEIIEAAQSPQDEIVKGWVKAADGVAALNIPLAKIGLKMRELMLLIRAQRYAIADQLTLQLLKKDKNNTEIERRRLKVLVELKKYAQAIELGQKVITNSYGHNEFFAAEVVAKAYVESGRHKEAAEFINKYLAREEMQWASMKSTQSAFEDLKKKLKL